jgi:hypothetical protein
MDERHGQQKKTFMKFNRLIKALADGAINVRPTTAAVFTSYVLTQRWRWAKLAREIELQVK